MITNILAVFACAFNMIGLLMYISGPMELSALYQRLSWKKKLPVFVGIAVLAQIIVLTGVYLVIFLAAEYAAILIWRRRHGGKHSGAAIRGMLNLLIVLLIELGIALQFYYQGVKWLTNADIRVISYLGMATAQYCLIVLHEIRGIGQGFKKMLLIALVLRAVENLVWLALCIRGALFEYDYPVLTSWFVFTTFMCYVVFYVVQFKINERNAIEKRADIHVNAYEYYLHMEEEHLRVRKLYHDMKNQLMILENDPNSLTPAHAAQIQAFSEQLDALEQFYHTGFASLDILLFDGKMKAESKGITFEATISEGCLSFMREEDVNVIFSNAITNAIEACEKITEGPRWIKLKAGKNLDDTLIYVQNTAAPTREKRSLRTGKKDKRLHGIGMTSIQECAERYKGYVSIIEENDTFQLAILFGGEQK